MPFDLTPDAFNDLARRLASHLGISFDAAEDLVALLGDVWETDPEDPDHILLRDASGHIIARVPLAVLEEES